MTPAPAVADTVVVITNFNTLPLTAAIVYNLVTSSSRPPAGPFYFNILNLGPGYVYIADSHDPTVGGPSSETLPPNIADNGIFVGEGTAGLRVLSDSSGATISVRVSRSLGDW